LFPRILHGIVKLQVRVECRGRVLRHDRVGPGPPLLGRVLESRRCREVGDQFVRLGADPALRVVVAVLRHLAKDRRGSSDPTRRRRSLEARCGP
jgi:hypothetical protein